MSPARRPNLFIIGAPKCGTTSLYEYLKGHPDVFMSPDKEPRYFAPDMVSGMAGDGMVHGRDEGRYLELFSGATHEKRVGEASTRYLQSRDAPRLIHEFEPDSRLVVMLRDPIEMMYSLHAENLAAKRGTENLASFADALAAEDDRRAGRRVPEGSNARLLLYRERARFGEQLQRWIDEFGREPLHVILLEDFSADPAAEFRRLLEFLEIDPNYVPSEFAVHNPSHQIRSRRLQSALTAEAPRRAVRQIIPRSLRDRVRRTLLRPLRRANKQASERPPLDPAIRLQLQRELRPDVEHLGRLLGRDLAALWWHEPAASGKADPR